jgi:hypothetical protein
VQTCARFLYFIRFDRAFNSKKVFAFDPIRKFPTDASRGKENNLLNNRQECHKKTVAHFGNPR